MIELLWLASVLGAAMFFLAGWMAGNARRAPVVMAAPADELPPPSLSLEPEVAFLRAELAAAQVAQVTDRNTVQQITHDLSAARAQVERLRIDLMRSQKQSSDLQSEG